MYPLTISLANQFLFVKQKLVIMTESFLYACESGAFAAVQETLMCWRFKEGDEKVEQRLNTVYPWGDGRYTPLVLAAMKPIAIMDSE